MKLEALQLKLSLFQSLAYTHWEFWEQCATFFMTNLQVKTFLGRVRNVFAALIFQHLDHQSVMLLHFAHMFLAGWEE